MKKFLLAILTPLLLAAMLCTPALASADAAVPAMMPAGSASPRNWDKLAPEGELSPSKIKGDSAMLIDAATGKVLFKKNANVTRYPASTTKIMTCLLALESGKELDGIVTIGSLPAADFAADSDNIGLKKGEKLSFDDLLAGMMVKSGNDAADAIAIHVAGSVDAFVKKMNQKAKDLGMKGTHYTCTNGLTDDEGHHTTAADMAKLAMAAVKYPEFLHLVSLPTYTIAPTNKTPDPRPLSSTNKLLGDGLYGYTNATGIKTGYTSMAQNALISSAQKDGMSLIAVDMHVDVRNDMWTDSVTMFEYGFRFFDTVDVQELLANQKMTLDVKNAASDQGTLDLVIKPRSLAFITGRRDAINELKNDPSKLLRTETITKDTAPIAQNETVGSVTYSYEGATVLTCDLIATRAVEEKALPTASPSQSATATAAATATSDAGGKTNAATPASSSGATIQTPKGVGTAILWVLAVVGALLIAVLAVWLWNLRRRGGKVVRRAYRSNDNARMK